MSNWTDVTAAVPELAAEVKARFEAHGLGFLATIRADGSPRISGIEPLFAGDELWLGMMWGSLKARDLLADPRLELHNASTDKDVSEGDARIHGRARVVDAPDELQAVREAFAEATGHPPPEGPMHLFAVDVTSVVHMRPDGDHLLIRSWDHTMGERRIERR